MVHNTILAATGEYDQLCVLVTTQRGFRHHTWFVHVLRGKKACENPPCLVLCVIQREIKLLNKGPRKAPTGNASISSPQRHPGRQLALSV